MGRRCSYLSRLREVQAAEASIVMGGGSSRADSSNFPFQLSDAEWKQRLSPAEFKVLRLGGTEMPGVGKYCSSFPKTGYFACRACDHPLYSASSKFPDRGWDAYDKCYWTNDASHVTIRKHLMSAEAVCSNCGSHLGHVFHGEGHTSTSERH